MPEENGKRKITIVSACMRKTGLPDFAINEVEVTAEEADNGIQFYLAEAQLLVDGFEEPFVHFAEGETPDFLLPAVRQYLDSLASVPQPIAPACVEEC